MEKDKLIHLVQRAQKGDSEAMGALFLEYKDVAYSIAMRETKNRTLSDDIVQETFIEAIQKIGDLQNPESFPAWLKAIAYHQCTRHYKKKEIVHETLVNENEEGFSVFDVQEETNASFIPDEALDQKDFKETILSLIEDLPDVQRSALTMFYFEELPLKVIAQVQGVSVNTANTRLNRGRMAMKGSIERYEKKHGIRLHSVAFFPFFRWLLAGTEETMSSGSAATVAKNISTATGVSIAATEAVAATATAATTSATATVSATVGIGAKIAAMPLVTKIIAGVLAVSIALGIPALRLREEEPGGTKPIVETTDVSGVQDSDYDFSEYGDLYKAGTQLVIEVLDSDGGIYYDYELDIFERCKIGGDSNSIEVIDEVYEIKDTVFKVPNLEAGYYYLMGVYSSNAEELVYFSVMVEEPSQGTSDVVQIKTQFPKIADVVSRIEVYNEGVYEGEYRFTYDDRGLLQSVYFAGNEDDTDAYHVSYQFDAARRLERSESSPAGVRYVYENDTLTSYFGYSGADVVECIVHGTQQGKVQRSSYGDSIIYETEYRLVDDSDESTQKLEVYSGTGADMQKYKEYRYYLDSNSNLAVVEEIEFVEEVRYNGVILIPAATICRYYAVIDVFPLNENAFVPTRNIHDSYGLIDDGNGNVYWLLPIPEPGYPSYEKDYVYIKAGTYEYRYVFSTMEDDVKRNLGSAIPEADAIP